MRQMGEILAASATALKEATEAESRATLAYININALERQISRQGAMS